MSAVMSAVACVGAVGLAVGFGDPGTAVDARLPDSSPTLAALALVALVALPTGAAAVAVARGGTHGGRWLVVSGSMLVAWIALEIAVIRTFSWLQPACAAYGVALSWTGIRLDESGGEQR
jgi:hypothetical protein